MPMVLCEVTCETPRNAAKLQAHACRVYKFLHTSRRTLFFIKEDTNRRDRPESWAAPSAWPGVPRRRGGARR